MNSGKAIGGLSHPKYFVDPERLRRGNVRVAMRQIAREEGVRLKQVKFQPIVRTIKSGRVLGVFQRDTGNIEIATQDWNGIYAKRNMTQIAETAAHEYSHASLAGETSGHNETHQRMTDETHAKILNRARALRASEVAKHLRKSATDRGGEVSVSAYDRDGYPVSAYTRSRPGK